MSSPNLGITHVAVAQNQKEVTLNDALDALDRAGNDSADLDVSSGNTAVPIVVWRGAFLLRLTGSPPTDFTVTVPDGKRVAAIHNTTARTVMLRAATAGATLTVKPGELIIVGARGSDLVPLAASALGGLYDMGLFIPGLLAVGCPLAVGFLMGAKALAGFLAGATAAGVLMAIFMANAGGAWDNAKKYIESGKYGGKGTPTHAAAVIGDTVGDPFKDTSGPAMNPLIKVAGTISVIAAPLLFM